MDKEKHVRLEEIIRFDERGLVPVVVQDFYSKDVLMLAYANREAIRKTLETGYAHYYSRSRQTLWMKGQTSGHTQRIKRILFDCDEDTLLYVVEQRGAACHTNHRSCFYREFYRGMIREIQPVLNDDFDGIVYGVERADGVMDRLYDLLIERKTLLPEQSYTAKLFRKGINEIAKKTGEEAVELVIALKDADQGQIVYEAADLLFHMLVGFAHYDIAPEAVFAELRRRFNISGETEKKTRKDG